MRVRAAARLNVADISRVRDVADGEDAEAAQTILADGVFDRFHTAVDAGGSSLTGDEEEVPINGDVALRCGANEAFLEYRRGGIGDIPELIAVIVALDDVVAEEREIGVRLSL